MKKFIYKSLLALSLIGVMAACDLESDPKSSAEQESVFSIYGLAEKAVMGIHQSFGETNSYRGRFLPYYGINSDIEWMNKIESQSEAKKQLVAYAATPTNSEMNTENNAWAKFYEGIERANMCIVGLRTYGNVETDPNMAHLLGEALTLRAVIYLDLVKGWGDVPARFEPITTETVYVPKADRDVIYKQLLADLKEAESLVAWPNESSQTTSVERVNKTFIKALRARVALYAGGYSQRADGVRLSNDSELNRTAMYTIARDECVDIINKGSNQLGAFETNFKNLCRDIVTAGGESIWEIPFSDGRGRVLFTLGVQHLAADQYTKQAKGGANGPLPYFFYDYDVDDVRRDITCVPYEWSKESQSKQQLRSIDSWCFGKLRYEWMDRMVTSTNDDGINWQYMRLADVYLMAAEAINELEGPSGAAQYLKPILTRALPAAKVDTYMSKATASKAAFFNAIVDQRAFEFAGESLRKADLIRWNLLKEKLDEAKTKMTQLANRQGAYADLPEKLYYKTGTDNESLIIYGLNHGETDAEGQKLVDAENYSSGKWVDATKLTEKLINALYQENPNENQYWPIWQTFIDSSNGTLTND
ncbi:RagB/SusD family nutrient uptake outer membrane protein [Dysgonomonas sp. 521]|uniref:RagB/SusD family nutrient uptake outer membrane protein n=1 Tax=Dysgonomonas sp. 521 TaxID=2302932 RepID=UPI0013D31496|nr:RagB/SusD family nutrient uptake outer membrane protein [Dysgonomonas sp. 521]NDV95900.1 RagB/SusD family nutrient uptake outer membrane protein [Dysgonomonas sp. 521]